MNLTRHTDYGLRVLMVLAAAAPGQRLATADIAEHFDVSVHHLHKVVRALQQAGYITTSRGRAGGMLLARPPGDIRLGAVVRDLEPSLDIVECFGDGTCALLPGCALKGALGRARAAFLDSLDAQTLADITPRQQLPGLQLRGEA